MTTMQINNHLTPPLAVLVKNEQNEAKRGSSKDFKKQFIRLITLLASLENVLVKNESNIQQNKADISKIGAKVSQQVFKEEVKKLKERLAEIEKMKHASFWHKVLGVLLSISSVLLGAISGGIGTGIVLAVFTTLQQTGVMKKMTDSICPDSKIGKFFVKVALIAAITAGGAAAAKGVDAALNASLKKMSTKFAKSFAEKGFTFVQDSYKFAAISSFSQILASTNPLQDLMEACGSDKDSLATMLVPMFMNMGIIFTSGFMMRNSFALEKLYDNPKIMSRVTNAAVITTIAAEAGESSTGICEGVIQLQIADITQKMAQYTAITQLISTGQRISSSQKEQLQQLMKSFSDMENSYKLFSIAGEAEARELIS